MNKFTVEITKYGFKEKLILNGKTYVKRYARTSYGYEGLDSVWDEETDLRFKLELTDALDANDRLDIMRALEDEES